MKKTKILLPALVLVLMLTMLCGCAKDEASNGDKIAFTLTVVHADKSQKEFEITTTETNLRRALEAENLISGQESEHGLFVTTVDGETADYSKDEGWWSLTKNGEPTSQGVDGCTVSDGDKYGFTYTIGY